MDLQQLRYEIALSMLPGADLALLRHMQDSGITLEDFFSMPSSELVSKLGLHNHALTDDMKRREAEFSALREIDFMKRHDVKALFIDSPDYPWRLTDVDNAPLILYQFGECDLSAEHMLSIVGTRHCTPYGVNFVDRTVADLHTYFPDLCIVSGLAYGIDAAAHSAALANNLPTIAVVAHGLNMIYPASHRDLASRIVRNGGAIITEYPGGFKPYRQRFLERNRIVAALCPATLVVESPIKGGAMSTANDAFSYNREVLALPGRSTDMQSEGCNHIIRCQKAQLVTSAADIMEAVGWNPMGIRTDARQRSLFPELSKSEQKIYDYLRSELEPQSLDKIHANTGLPVAEIMSCLSEMEFAGATLRHPGNRYSTI